MTLMDAGLRPFSGSKGPDEPEQTADSLFSTDVVEGIFGISEGPIKGLVNGGKSFYIGDTPLKNVNGSANFDNFELVTYKGSDAGEVIRSRLGGFAGSSNVNVNLATNVPVPWTGTLTNIDYLDVRFVINQLQKANDKGTFNNTGKWKLEYKALSASTWKPVRTSKNSPGKEDQTSDFLDVFYNDAKGKNKKGNPGDRPYFIATTQPVTTADMAIWFDSTAGQNYKPKIYAGGSGGWSHPSLLAYDSTNSRWTWRERDSWGRDKATKLFIGTKPIKSAGYERGDFWLNPGSAKVYYFNGNRWIEAGTSIVPGGFGDNGTGGKVSVSNGEIAITAKTTSPFPKEFRIPVARINEPYQLRATKTSPANTTEKVFDITWESVQEVTAKGWTFPGLAVTQIVARASEQFSSLPEFWGVYDLRLIRVPSNYNPVTRVYTGVWDGTWKIDWSNNPAFVANDIVMNDRFGMNRYYPIVLNKWDVYDAGVHCDTLTADGKPRFTFNGLITEPKGGRDMVNYICGLFGGRFFDDGNGMGAIKIDKDSDPVVQFTPENVVDGIFAYSFTELSTRHNDLTVTFTNPDLNWQEDRRRLTDPDNIDAVGTIPRSFAAVGCTDASEAIIRARYQLITGLREKMMVSFKTNRQGLYLGPYDVISIADEDMAMGLSGRVKAVTGARSVTLRDAIFLEPGHNYRASFTIVNTTTAAFETVSRPITVGLSGAQTTLTFTQDLPTLPELAVFTIERVDGSAAPKAFRVLSITPVDGDPDNIEIQAMEMYRAKWLYIDGVLEDIGEVDAYQLEFGKKPEPVADLRIQGFQVGTPKKPVVNIKLDWDKSPTKIVKKYRVFGSRNNDPIALLAETPTLEFTLENVPPGEWYFEVIAVSVNDKESIATAIDYRLVGEFRDIDTIENLILVGGVSETESESRNPRFNWDDSNDPDFKEFGVRIKKPNGTIVRSTSTRKSEFTYRLKDNKADNTTPIWAFTIEVCVRDRYGWESEWTALSITTPVPEKAEILTVNSVPKGMRIATKECIATEYKKTLYWSYPSSLDATNDTNATALEAQAGEVYIDDTERVDDTVVWYRAAYRDSAGNTGPKSDPKSATYQFVKSTDLKNKAVTFEKLDDQSVDTSKIKLGAVEGQKRIVDKDMSTVRARRDPILSTVHWPNNNGNTKYVEEIQIGEKITIPNGIGTRLQIAWDFKVNNQAFDDGASFSGKTWVYAKLILQKKKASDGNNKWRAVSQVKAASARSSEKGADDLEPSKGDSYGLTNIVGVKGSWDFRVLLLVEHRRESERNNFRCTVYAGADVNFTWRKV